MGTAPIGELAALRPPAEPGSRARDVKRAASPTRVVFLFLGRNGSFGQFALELAAAAANDGNIEPSLVIARSSKIGARLAPPAAQHLQLDTWDDRPLPQLITNFPAARRALLAHLASNRPAAVVTLMPHLWTPLLAPAIRRLGILYVSVVHDAIAHPGDPTAILTPWLLRDTRHADLIVTLSRAVAERLKEAGRTPPSRIAALFHPDLQYGRAPGARRRRVGEPLRLLFFGRMLKYKGLPLLIEAVEKLRAEGVEVRLGVAGTGNIDNERGKLSALQAEVINRWIEDDEVGPLFARYDAVAVSHIEASQSGVAATAFGSRMPVVATPVGGLIEQVVAGRTGLLAQRADAASLADCIRRLARDPALYDTISQTLADTGPDRSMGRFVAELATLVGAALPVGGRAP